MAEVNERVREEWEGDTTPGERVRTIVRRTYGLQSASTIADRALVSEWFARFYLDRLAEDEFVEVDGGRYRRAPESVIRERAEQILDTVDVETLEKRVEGLRATVRGYEASDDLTDDEVVEQTDRRNLRVAEAALEFGEGSDE